MTTIQVRWRASADGSQIRLLDDASTPGDWVDCQDAQGGWLEPGHGTDTWDDAAKAFVADASSRAASKPLTARQFSLRARPLLQAKTAVAGHPLNGLTISAPIEDWMMSYVAALPDATVASTLSLPNAALIAGLDLDAVDGETANAQAARIKTALIDIIFSANEYHFTDMVPVLGLFGVTSTEVAALYS